MAERHTARVWVLRLTFVGLCLTVLFFQLLPLETMPRRWAGPDLVVALCFAWVLRRPDCVPVLAIAAVMLLADLVLQRPPGLWAALVVLATEWMKGSQRRSRETTFVLEWLGVGLVLTVITVAYRVILSLLIVTDGSFFLAFSQLIMTVLIYPLVVLLSHLVFGVRRAAPGDIDALGRMP